MHVHVPELHGLSSDYIAFSSCQFVLLKQLLLFYFNYTHKIADNFIEALIMLT